MDAGGEILASNQEYCVDEKRFFTFWAYIRYTLPFALVIVSGHSRLSITNFPGHSARHALNAST